MSTTLVNARIVAQDTVFDGWLSIEEGRITHIGHGGAPRDGESLDHRLVVPGFVDMHVHGGGGAGYPTGLAPEARRAFAFHLSHGTTTAVASLVTAPLDHLRRAAGELAELCREGLLAGIHFEGPYISAAKCGAHRPALLREPSVAEFLDLIKAAHGHARMFTIAPELPNALDAIAACAANGVIAAIGHTDATYDEAEAAIDAGATVATHLFNAMRPLGHRDPGPITAALADERVTVELINDGFHLHEAVIDLALRSAKGGVAFVTDAMDAAGMPDGDYDLGPMRVEVRGGEARLEGGGSIAGSTLTMDKAFRRGVQLNGLTLSQATEVTSLNPAKALGLDDEIGSIAVGKRADLVVLDDDLHVHRVMRHGEWV
ncbi:N-acetylglucosamine-6-phosphate deacetylase [Herbidospora cretacea]|uniref:N-acetylglucosamine-6-phosphate deacetylase n=1 Tax=Herbidospora cretacea TaxID=28444 RepID=UPI0004C3AA8E|nr:N-acetylglucosamine-6-phosphate deacetylase [Herbidospora cretacea]